MSKVKIRKVKPEDFIPQAHFVSKEGELRYVIAPKGCAYLALAECGIKVDEMVFNRFWEQFCTNLENAGYVIE